MSEAARAVPSARPPSIGARISNLYPYVKAKALLVSQNTCMLGRWYLEYWVWTYWDSHAYGRPRVKGLPSKSTTNKAVGK